MLNGQKRWIGNATFADIIVIWARSSETKQVGSLLADPLRSVIEHPRMGFIRGLRHCWEQVNKCVWSFWIASTA